MADRNERQGAGEMKALKDEARLLEGRVYGAENAIKALRQDVCSILDGPESLEARLQAVEAFMGGFEQAEKGEWVCEDCGHAIHDGLCSDGCTMDGAPRSPEEAESEMGVNDCEKILEGGWLCEGSKGHEGPHYVLRNG